MEKDTKNSGQSLIFLNKYYKAIMFALAAVILAVGYFLVINKSIANLKQKKTTLAVEKLQEFKHAEQYFKKLEELNKAIDNFQKENRAVLAKLEQVLPDNSQVPELIAQVEALIKSSGFSLDGFAITEGESAAKKSSAQRRPAAVDTAEGTEGDNAINEIQDNKPALKSLPAEVKSLKISLAVSGKDYFAFKELLKIIEQHIRIFDVTSISFGGDTGEGGYSLNLQTYYLN